MFGGIADHHDEDLVSSMRFAMGTLTYWSVVAAVFLLVAALIKFKRDRSPHAGEQVDTVIGEDYMRFGK